MPKTAFWTPECAHWSDHIAFCNARGASAYSVDYKGLMKVIPSPVHASPEVRLSTTVNLRTACSYPQARIATKPEDLKDLKGLILPTIGKRSFSERKWELGPLGPLGPWRLTRPGPLHFAMRIGLIGWK
jgi:hypothetical protein